MKRDALGRVRRPSQDTALRRINDTRRRQGWRTAPARHFMVPVDLMVLYESLDARERSTLLAEALGHLKEGTWRLERKANGVVVVDAGPS